MGWPLEARRSLFPDWLWLCDESSQHGMALHILVQILAGKFNMEFLRPLVSLSKAFPVAKIRPNLHKIVMASFPIVAGASEEGPVGPRRIEWMFNTLLCGSMHFVLYGSSNGRLF